MAFDPFLAIRFTPYHASRTDWPDHLGQVFGLLGFRTRNPTPREFVTAVHGWQVTHPPLTGDGLLGPHTWAAMRPTVVAYSGAVPAGNCPAWIGPASPVPPVGDGLNPPSDVITPVAGTGEDRVLLAILQEWLRVGGTVDAGSPVAVPVRVESVSDVVRRGVLSLATGGVCGELRVGQVWPGIAGNRTVVALVVGNRPAVVFVTDGGQAYVQTPDGWDADYLAGVYSGDVRNLVPFRTLGDTEILGLFEAAGRRSGPRQSSV